MSHERLYRWIQDTQPRVVLTCAHVNPRLPRRVAALQAPCVEQTPPGFAFELLTVGAASVQVDTTCPHASKRLQQWKALHPNLVTEWTGKPVRLRASKPVDIANPPVSRRAVLGLPSDDLPVDAVANDATRLIQAVRYLAQRYDFETDPQVLNTLCAPQATLLNCSGCNACQTCTKTYSCLQMHTAGNHWRLEHNLDECNGHSENPFCPIGVLQVHEPAQWAQQLSEPVQTLESMVVHECTKCHVPFATAVPAEDSALATEEPAESANPETTKLATTETVDPATTELGEQLSKQGSAQVLCTTCQMKESNPFEMVLPPGFVRRK